MPDKLTDKATKFLTELLQDGPLPASDIQQMAEEFEIPTNALRRAKEALHIISTKEKQESGRWLWELPQHLIKPATPEPPKPDWMTKSHCQRCDTPFPLEQTRYHIDGTIVRGYCPDCREAMKQERRKELGRRLWDLMQVRNDISIDPTDPQLKPLDAQIEGLQAMGIEPRTRGVKS